MDDLLVKIHINKMNLNKNTNQLIIQGPLPPAGSPHIVLGFPFPRSRKEEGRGCSAAPLRPSSTQSPQLPQPGPAQ